MTLPTRGISCHVRQAHQRIRNRLADIFLGAFEEAEKRRAIFALGAYCGVSVNRGSRSDSPFEPMPDSGLLPMETGRIEESTFAILNDAGLLCLRQHPDSEGEGGTALDLSPVAQAALPLVRDRVRRYQEVLEQAAAMGTATGQDRVHRVLAEAALCFNAGLFFEAHEHLEQIWISLPRGPLRQLLQGLIQVSVGFHHAERGRYDGAVNLLGKGLAKLGARGSEVVGLDVAEFVREVRGAQQRIVARGRQGIQPMSREEIPRMRLRW